jgi:hypothetical protein
MAQSESEPESRESSDCGQVESEPDNVGSGRKGAVEAIRDFIPQPPGCRQGTSLAPVAAWQLLPSSGKKVWSLGPADFWIDDAISGSRRGLVGSKAAESGQRRAYEASRAQQSDRPPIAKRAIRERHGKR